MAASPLRPWLAGAAALALFLAACGDDGDDADATDDPIETTAPSDDGEAPAGSGETLVLGYSAWPGWFPLAVAEEAGIFEELGLDVELTFFADYLGSLDAMAAGQLDGNTQTLNDTMFAVAAGDEQVIVVNNDFSSGNDAIICDESVGTEIADLEGLTIAAEAGVVDHFLLLQGLASVGLTEDDIEFRGVLTDAAAAGFADGEFDCVGVFAPFTLTALQRPGSFVLFDSSDFPGTISDHIVVSPELIEERPEDVQLLVDAWYATLDYIEANPDEALAILAEAAGTSVEEYESFAAGTDILDVERAVTAFEEGDDTTSLLFTAALINPFLVESGLTEQEAEIEGLFDPTFTADYASRAG
jgi:NitT/TauT family transport system substrate-binding protein